MFFDFFVIHSTSKTSSDKLREKSLNVLEVNMNLKSIRLTVMDKVWIIYVFRVLLMLSTMWRYYNVT